jgi:hypothetical protein
MAILFLLKKAYHRGYDRYSLISGQDLPIKTNREIISFFENNKHREYIHIMKLSAPNTRFRSNLSINSVTKYWPNYKYHKSKNLLLRVLHKFIRIFFELFSIIMSRSIDYEFYRGLVYADYTHKCMDQIFKYLENNVEYVNRFKMTHISEEIFFPTLLKQLDGLEIINDNLRYATKDREDWLDYPKILKKCDYEKIINSNKLFARKFDMDVDKEIIDMIYEKIGW